MAFEVKSDGVSRRSMLVSSVGLIGSAMIPGGLIVPAFADDMPAMGTWPAGSQGDSVTIGAAVPRTGAYAVQGEDELKGMQLAVEHINSGHDLIKKIAPKITKGVLGKEVKLVVADSGAKPNQAVQEQQTFINENKIVADDRFDLVARSRWRSTSSPSARRYCISWRSRAPTTRPARIARATPSASASMAKPRRTRSARCCVKAYGKGKKAAFMTPDYTYGHTVTKSVNDYLTANGGWTQVTDQVSPLGTQDFSQYLTNIANSGADVIINVNWGRDAVLSVQQAKQFGLTPKMKMVIPYQIPFLAKEVGPDLTEGVYAATDFWWTLEDKFPLAKMFVDEFDKKYGYKPEWGANNAYMQFAIWARMVSGAGTFYPPGGHQGI